MYHLEQEDDDSVFECGATVTEVILKESYKTLKQVFGSLIWLLVYASQVEEVRSGGLETIMLTDFLRYVIQGS